jgi:nitrite reductase (NO-forming)
VSPEEEPDTTPPADVSHGEAPIGGPAAEPAPTLARLAPAERTKLHRIRMEMTHTIVNVAPGVRYAAWTFEGGVPGPALRVRQGDTVAFTLINKANIPHSMDFHAAEIAPNKYYVNVMPTRCSTSSSRGSQGRSCITAARRRWRCTSPTGCTVP